MTKRLGGTLAVLVLLGGCAPPPQQQTEPLMPQPWVAQPRVYALLGERQELGLTSEQITALDSVGVAVAEENAPLVARVRELQGADTGRRRRMTEETAEALRSLLTEIRDNNQEAHARVQELLTEAQERKVCEVFGRPRSAREERRIREQEERERRMRERRPGVMADTVSMAGGRARVWPWCGPQPAQPDTARADTVPAPPR